MRNVFTLIAISALVVLAIPAFAFAAPGYTRANVYMRAGPGIGYPIVTIIPERAPVEIYGCLADRAWCDLSWDGYRGWVSANYLVYYYQGRYVYLQNYFGPIPIPIIPFVLGTYWRQHYVGRPWYRQRDHWENYWRGHRRPSAMPYRHRYTSPTRPYRPTFRTPERHAPSMRGSEHRVPAMRAPGYRTPSVRGPEHYVPSGRSRVPQGLHVPGHRVSPHRPGVRPRGGGTTHRPAPHSRTRGYRGPSHRQHSTARRDGHHTGRHGSRRNERPSGERRDHR